MQSSLPYDPYRVSGTTTAHVFKKIADRIYFSDHELRNQLSTDSSMVFAIPEMKKGYTDDFTRVFSQLSIPYTAMPAGEWTNLRRTTDSVEPQLCVLNTETIPDLRGMGVRDAVFLAENAGLRVSVKGYGKVYKQSLPPGTAIRKGEKIVLELK